MRFAAALLVLAWAGAAGAETPALGHAQTVYAMRCAGCHGLEGVSPPAVVPALRGQVGGFLCLQEGRDYLVRVPGVALSLVGDDDLAAVMNFVAFTLGGASTPSGTAPFDAAEIARLRREPLNEVSLRAYRATLVERAIVDCGAPAGLRAYGTAE
ncbi:MAG TPA: c-type cytochrome [Stellaceae bacterium]|nr:c-type cytochrome [Stellaceae bacterium]